MSKRRILFIGGGILTVAACATTLKYHEDLLSEKLNFSHQRHLSEADCGDCHGGVEGDLGPTQGKYVGRGDHGGCVECHEVDDETACKSCHLSDDYQVELPHKDRKLKFAHAQHADVEGGCETCHAGVKTATKPGLSLVPGHDTCKTCHAEAYEKAQCTLCHQDLHRQGLRPTSVAAHDGDFLKRHGKFAQDTEPCMACHDQTYCSECHAQTTALTQPIRFPEKIEGNFIHRGDWIARHASSARTDSSTCSQCHGTAFCVSCHELNGLAAVGPVSTPTALQQVHGPGFMNPTSPDFHGRQARRNISKCASCHDRGAMSNCVDCHRVGGVGGNPHPREFNWTDKANDCRNNGMCAACHLGGSGCN